MTKKNESNSASRKSVSGRKTSSQSYAAQKNVFNIWADGYGSISKMWQDSYANLYGPWMESAGKILDKTVDLSKEATPDKYQEFLQELVKTQTNTLGTIYPFPKATTDRETLEKFMDGALKSTNLLKSWSKELEENIGKTQKMLVAGGASPENYREFYDMWISSYEKIFDESFDMVTAENAREIMRTYLGVPDMFLASVADMARLWKESYKNVYTPWIESTSKLSEKLIELSKENATAEQYKEFYEQWMDSYRETYAKMFSIEVTKPSQDMLENMLDSVNTSTQMYRSWLTNLEKLAAKMKDVLTSTSDPKDYKEFYELWLKTYEKAYTDFFEFMPNLEPLKKILEPMRSAAKAHADTYSNAMKTWMELLIEQRQTGK